MATDEETKTGTDTTRAVTPAGMKSAIDASLSSATEEKAGTVRLATPDEAKIGTATGTAVSPASLKVAVDDRAATAEEVSVGTASAKFVTPAALKTVIDGLNQAIESLTNRVEDLEGASASASVGDN